MQIVIVAAGRGTRFAQTTEVPKPFIKVHNKPMWQHAAEPWLKYGKIHTVFNHTHRGYYEKPDFPCSVTWLDKFTRGAAESAYLGSMELDAYEPICFVDSDGTIEFSQWDPTYGGSFVVQRDNPQHSYVKLNDGGFIKDVAEKQVISNLANTGHYWWSKLYEFQRVFRYAEQYGMTTKNEFYMSLMYKLGLDMGYKFRTQQADAWHCWGTPKDLEEYLNATNITPRES